MSRPQPILATGLAVVICATFATAAFAAPSLSTETTTSDDADNTAYEFVVTDERPSTDGGTTDVERGSVARVPLLVHDYQVLDIDRLTREDCRRTEYIVVWDESQRGPAADSYRLSSEAYAINVGTSNPPVCTSTTVDPGAPARTAAERIADNLDTAMPYLQPSNRAITGVRSHLDTGIESSFTKTVSVNLFGRDWDVEVTASGVHTIDWGDGTVDTDVTADGGPWHDGDVGPQDITHFYGATGEYLLRVTTDWTVTAVLLSNGATATQSATTTSAPITIDVDEVRSVREN